MSDRLKTLALLLFNLFATLSAAHDGEMVPQLLSNSLSANDDVLTPKSFVFWPNGTIPFYINSSHFDHEQRLQILTAVAGIAFKSCLKFQPVLREPGRQHVLVFRNPGGEKRCTFAQDGHDREGPHYVTLGYRCLGSPGVDAAVMRALGFPFEHNRLIRDLYVGVQLQNVEAGHEELFTKDSRLPQELRSLPYDINSVTHFGERDFSKNGHKTIVIKNRGTRQERRSLSGLDLRRIEIVYGPECLKRDRAAKMADCLPYYPPPPLQRRKREAVPVPIALPGQSLRVNPAITPPPAPAQPAAVAPPPAPDAHPPAPAEAGELPEELSQRLKALGIEEQVQEIVDKIHQVTSKALTDAQENYCNQTETKPSDATKAVGLVDILETVAFYTESMVHHAVQNLTSFCEAADPVAFYQRAPWCQFGDPRCAKTYFKSTHLWHLGSTQYRPSVVQSTKNWSHDKGRWHRARNDNETDSKEAASPTLDDAVTNVRKKRGGTDYNDGAIETDSKGAANPVPLDELVTKARKKREGTDYNDGAIETDNKDAVNPVPLDELVTKARKKREVTDYNDGAIETDNKDAVNPVPLDKLVTKARKKREGTDYNDGAIETDNKDAVNPVPLDKLVTKARKKREGIDYNDGAIETDNKDAVNPVPLDKLVTKARKKREVTDYNDGAIETDSKDAVINPVSSDELVTKARKKREVTNDDVITPRYRVQHAATTAANKLKFTGEPREMYKPRQDSDDEWAETAKVTAMQFESDDDEAKRDRHSDVDAMEKKHSIDEPKRKPYRAKVIEYAPVSSKEEVEPKRVRQSEPAEEHVKPWKPKKKVDSANNMEKRKAYYPKTVNLSKLNEEFYDARRWRDGVVRYVIADVNENYNLTDMRNRLNAVNLILKRTTCVWIQEISEQDASRFEDYLVIDTSPDYVTGRVGGRQNFGSVELFAGGQPRQHAAMMVMAMLGFYFEVSRHDREKFIVVHPRNIRPDKLHHFEMIRADATLPVPYDYRSATHPNWQFWRKIGRPAVATVATYKEKDPEGKIMRMLGRNRRLLSEIDLVKINSVYGTKCMGGKHPRSTTRDKSQTYNMRWYK